MGGMFTMVKVREGLAPDARAVAGWYEHPEGTVAREWTGDAVGAVRQGGPAADNDTLQVRKPGGAHEHH